jgi:hypothetical protein
VDLYPPFFDAVLFAFLFKKKGDECQRNNDLQLSLFKKMAKGLEIWAE